MFCYKRNPEKEIFCNNELKVDWEHHYVIAGDHIFSFPRLEDAYQCYKQLTE